MIEILGRIAAGAVSGLIASALGYAKSTGEKVDYEKLGQTVIIGAVVGGIGGYMGMTYTQAQEWLGSIGGITLIEYVKKAVWRRIKK